jgi:hypothetical protein
MAVLGRLLIAGAERVDLPDLLSIDSFVAGDFKFLLKGLVGDTKPLILNGFDVINPNDAIGTQSISIRVADSVVLYPGSNAGPFFHGLPEGNQFALPVVPELRKNAVNYVYLTLSTFDTAQDTRAFWDPDLDGGVGGEFTQDINTQSALKVEVNVSTSSFPANTVPVCIVTVGPAVIEDIEDARNLMYRLGSGGLNPDPFSRFNFASEPSSTYQRSEPPTKMSSALDPNAFQGGDKNIKSLKDWMDVVMTKLAELGGTTYWYEEAAALSLSDLFIDALGSTHVSKGQWSHSSATAGQLTWTEDIQIKNIADNRDVIIRSGSKTLQNEEVMYVQLVRDGDFNGGSQPVDWFNGLNFANGLVGSFANLVKGDWVKKKGDPNNYNVRVEEFYANTNLTGGVTTPALARSIKLSSNYSGLTESKLGSRTQGVYTSAQVVLANRFDGTLNDLGGDLHWLALRSDTIMNISSISTSTITGNITDSDGTKAKFTMVGHGLVDGDYITIAGSAFYDGTYKVEVESADVFYIATSVTNNEVGVSGYIAIATTTTRSTADGLQLESASHNFSDDDTIIIDTSSSYDGSHLINTRSATTFSFAIGSALPVVNSGTATLARINIRSNIGLDELVQGQSIGIGTPDSNNIMSYIGMGGASQSHPTYDLPLSYNTLLGTADYNGLIDDNLTVRVAKLTAMMADKAQDKTVKLLSSGITYTVNTTNGAAQEVTFLAAGATLTLVTPGSNGNATVALPDTAPGISLLANQLAYVSINRNSTSTPSIIVSDIVDCPIDENIFVIAVRLSSTDVYLWDGSLAGPKAINGNVKVIGGGVVSWNSGTGNLSFTAPFYLEMSGLTYADNTISASPINLPTSLDVAYVIPNLLSGGPALTVNVGSLSSVPKNAVIIARRETNDVIVGSSSIRLANGQSASLYAQMSNQNLTFIGATGTADSAPSYSSSIRGTAAQSLTARAGVLTDAIGDSQEDRSAYLRSDNPVTWTGSQLQFSTDIVLEIINTKSGTLKAATIQVASSPISLADNESAWVLIDRTLASENLTINLSGTTPIPAQTQANKDVIVIARRKDALGAGYLHLPLHKQVLEPGQTVRLGASGSGDGGGNEILETLKNHFIDGTFDLLTPNIFRIDKDDKVDGASTGAYSLVTRTFEFSGAGQTMISTQSADETEFLANTNALGEVELMAFWNEDYIDTAATYAVSRNGGNEWQTVTMDRVGSTELYRAIHKFTDEATNQNLFTQLVSDTTRALTTTNDQELSQRFVIPSGSKMLVKDLIVALTKTGAPTGNLYVSICTDSVGDPDTVLVESNAIPMTSLVTGNNTIDLPDVYLAAGTYHIKFRTDATYKGVYSAGVTQIAVQSQAVGVAPFLRRYNGTVWSNASTENLTYTLRGITIDLRFRVTSSAGSKKLDGYGIFYDKSIGNISTGILQREVFHFDGTANLNEFTLTKFIPNPDLLKVYDVTSGQVYTFGAWTLQGQKVVFEVNQFNSPGNPITLVFDQTTGGAFDNSDLNGLLLANNHLGSTDTSIDKSVNGRGIFLRRPDGTLREICIDDSDNIVVYSV